MKRVTVEINTPAGLDRRQFLKAGSGILMGTLAASSGLLAMVAPSRAWALSLKALSENEASGILKVTRGIFPHDTLDDAVYALVVKDLDAAAADDAAGVVEAIWRCLTCTYPTHSRFDADHGQWRGHVAESAVGEGPGPTARWQA